MDASKPDDGTRKRTRVGEAQRKDGSDRRMTNGYSSYSVNSLTHSFHRFAAVDVAAVAASDGIRTACSVHTSSGNQMNRARIVDIDVGVEVVVVGIGIVDCFDSIHAHVVAYVCEMMSVVVVRESMYSMDGYLSSPQHVAVAEDGRVGSKKTCARRRRPMERGEQHS